MNRCEVFVGPPLRLEFEGVFPGLGASSEREYVDEHPGSLRNSVAIELGVRHGLSWDCEGTGRVQAEGFFHDAHEVRELADV